MWNIIAISKKNYLCVFAYFLFWSSMQNCFSRLKVFSWNVPTFFAVRTSTDRLLPPTFPLGPHRLGLRQPGWVLGQSQTSACWVGNWRCSILHNLCCRVKSTFCFVLFLKPDVVVLLGHCSHLNLPLRNVFGFVLVGILFSKICSATTNFPIQLCFLFYFSLLWDFTWCVFSWD